MSARRVLREACQVVTRSHASPPRGIAATEHGHHCHPLSPAAAGWTSVGALYVADPVRRDDAPDTHGEHAWAAYLLLEQAAREQGHGFVLAADRAGQSAVVKLFWRAGQLAEPDGRARRRGGRASGAGSMPRGGDAA